MWAIHAKPLRRLDGMIGGEDVLHNPSRNLLTQSGLFKQLMEHAEVKEQLVADVMEAALPMVDMDMPLERLGHIINKETGAVLARDESGQYHILTKYDILNAFSKG